MIRLIYGLRISGRYGGKTRSPQPGNAPNPPLCSSKLPFAPNAPANYAYSTRGLTQTTARQCAWRRNRGCLNMGTVKPGVANRRTHRMSENVVWQGAYVGTDTRARITGLRGATVWLTGLPASGKSTVARACEQHLLARGKASYVLDGDNLRHGLTGDLGFSRQDRAESVRRVAHVAEILTDAGIVTLVALISPYAADRRLAREIHDSSGHLFLEVWMDTPLAVCERRDPKGLYERARRGELTGLTGFDAPYESPVTPDLRLRSLSVRQAVATVVSVLEDRGLIGMPPELRGNGHKPQDIEVKSPLTLREREVLQMIERGLANKEIASQLSITVATVKNHVHRILGKMEADSRGQAAAQWRAHADAADTAWDETHPWTGQDRQFCG